MGRTVNKADLSEIVGRDERTLTRWQPQPTFSTESARSGLSITLDQNAVFTTLCF